MVVEEQVLPTDRHFLVAREVHLAQHLHVRRRKVPDRVHHCKVAELAPLRVVVHDAVVRRANLPGLQVHLGKAETLYEVQLHLIVLEAVHHDLLRLRHNVNEPTEGS